MSKNVEEEGYEYYDFTQFLACPRWKDRDGETWGIGVNNANYKSNDPDPFSDPEYRYANTRNKSKLFVCIDSLQYLTSSVLMKTEDGKTWILDMDDKRLPPGIRDYYFSNPSNRRIYKTPYQAKIAAEEYITNVCDILGY